MSPLAKDTQKGVPSHTESIRHFRTYDTTLILDDAKMGHWDLLFSLSVFVYNIHMGAGVALQGTCFACLIMCIIFRQWVFGLTLGDSGC
jgi:hypothetical protein